MSGRGLEARIARRLARYGGAADADLVKAVGAYIGLLAKWNKRLSLTSLQLEPPTDESIDRLVVEPVLAARRIDRADSLAVDLGSGGGSPAVPIKLAAPWLRLVMVESKARKSAFLRELTRQLALADTEVANARFEELLTRVDLHEAADLVTVRAVRADERLWSTAQAFLRPGGRLFWFTSADTARLSVLPPLVLESTETLVPASSSALVVLRKQPR